MVAKGEGSMFEDKKVLWGGMGAGVVLLSMFVFWWVSGLPFAGQSSEISTGLSEEEFLAAFTPSGPPDPALLAELEASLSNFTPPASGEGSLNEEEIQALVNHPDFQVPLQ